MVWLGFFEKNVFLRTSGVRAKPSKRISTFSVAKGLRNQFIHNLISLRGNMLMFCAPLMNSYVCKSNLFCTRCTTFYYRLANELAPTGEGVACSTEPHR